ncbi:cytochrome C oxidase subunit IV family protein [Paracoccus litorisediminis]|jgi:hypothetical protein|uniref:Cytochrome C oxidase subunit IV n=1 Tax=Paracoccus litorisediminis TaxID=2006130 RepID=A0A844HW04_9RHOB|nr:cytochrome C oxidase subunit IV family protein [Paracoccus litorisediminis]MTH61701.1 hypothetical protein [Paracoccus litorisediminis]
MDRLTRNWLTLIALIAMTLALSAFDGRPVAVGLLALAFFKARAILGGFLHLRGAAGWLAAATVPLGIWLGLLWGLNAALIR